MIFGRALDFPIPTYEQVGEAHTTLRFDIPVSLAGLKVRPQQFCDHLAALLSQHYSARSTTQPELLYKLRGGQLLHVILTISH